MQYINDKDMSLSTFCANYHVDRVTALNLIADGTLKAHSVGHRVKVLFIKHDSIAAYEASAGRHKLSSVTPLFNVSDSPINSFGNV